MPNHTLRPRPFPQGIDGSRLEAEGPGSACVLGGTMNADDRRKALIAARCCGPRTLHTRSADASHNALATGS